jgi:hypothetical protein
VTNEGETNMDWLFETFMVVVMICTKLSAVTGTEAPLNMSWQFTGRVSPILLVPVLVQPTAVLMAAVAFELAVWANVAVAVRRATAMVAASVRTNAFSVANVFMKSSVCHRDPRGRGDGSGLNGL